MRVSITWGGRRGVDLEIVRIRLSRRTHRSLRYPYAGAPSQRCSERRRIGVLLPPNAKNGMIGIWAAVALGRRHLICSRQDRQESLCRHR